MTDLLTHPALGFLIGAGAVALGIGIGATIYGVIREYRKQ